MSKKCKNCGTMLDEGTEDPKFAAVLSITKVWAWEGDVVSDEMSAATSRDVPALSFVLL